MLNSKGRARPAHLAVLRQAHRQRAQGVAGHALAHPASGGHVLVAGNVTGLEAEGGCERWQPEEG